MRYRCAVLDDYQNVTLKMADWSQVTGDVDVTVFNHGLGDDAAVVHMYTEGERGAPRNEGERLRRTHFHLVLGMQKDAWKVVHTAIMDPR